MICCLKAANHKVEGTSHKSTIDLNKNKTYIKHKKKEKYHKLIKQIKALS